MAQHVEICHLEEFRAAAKGIQRHEGKGAVRVLVGIAAGLLFLQPGDDLRHLGAVPVHIGQDAAETGVHPGAASLIADEEAALVAHAFRGDLLEGGGVLDHAVDVHTALVGEGGVAHKGGALGEGEVHHLGHIAGGVGQHGQVAFRQAGLVEL